MSFWFVNVRCQFLSRHYRRRLCVSSTNQYRLYFEGLRKKYKLFVQKLWLKMLFNARREKETLMFLHQHDCEPISPMLITTFRDSNQGKVAFFLGGRPNLLIAQNCTLYYNFVVFAPYFRCLSLFSPSSLQVNFLRHE